MAVDWLELIHKDFVSLQKDVADKEELLEFLADQFARHPNLGRCKRDHILQSLKEREEQGPTGLGGGIAAPHCGLKKAERFVVVVVTLAQGIDFAAFDSVPCNFIIAIVGPEEERSQHVQILASMASALQKIEEIQALLSCMDWNQGLEILGRIFSVDFLASSANLDTLHTKTVETSVPMGLNTTHSSTHSRLTIFLQREKFFMHLLEEAVRASGGFVTVIEGHNVAEYLHRMPLYAFIINDKKMNKFFRCIEAIVPKSELQSIYETVRRIDKKIEKKPGLLIFHQDIHDVLGSLDY